MQTGLEFLKREDMKTIQDRPPNFRNSDGKLYLVRCFACNEDSGTENYAPNVVTGVCTWCGWVEEKEEKDERK